MAQELNTLNDVLALATGRGEQTVMLWQDKAGAWLPITSNELKRRVQSLAAAFKVWGIRKGDRIAILSENRWEWAVTDFAALALGAVDVPLYPTLTAEQAAYALRDSGARVAVVSTRAQYEKVASILFRRRSVERILVMDSSPEQWKKDNGLVGERLRRSRSSWTARQGMKPPSPPWCARPSPTTWRRSSTPPAPRASRRA